MRVFAVIVLVILALAPLADAGSRDDPEITDAADDHKVTGGAPDAGGLIKSADLIQGWVEAVTDTHVEFRLQAVQTMRGGSSNGQSTTTYDYSFNFKVGGAAYVATATVQGPAPPTVTPKGVASEAYIAEGTDHTMVYIVPLTSIGEPGPGDMITDMYATSKVYVSAATLGTDRAPDSGFGRDFEIPAPALGVTYQNITAFPFLVESTNATSGVFQYNWTGDGALRFLGQVTEGNLTLNVTANGESVFAWNGTEGFDASMEQAFACVDETVTPAPCDFAFTYTLTEFVGLYGIDFAVEKTYSETNATDGPPAVDGDETPVDGNETDESLDGVPDSKESPLFALPLLMAALIAIARRK